MVVRRVGVYLSLTGYAYCKIHTCLWFFDYYASLNSLEYWRGSLFGIEHIAAVCKAAGRFERFYATHVRNRDLYYNFAFNEAIAVSASRFHIYSPNPMPHWPVVEPRHYATGIAHVLVNGQAVMRDGQRLDVNPGQVLRQ